MAERDENASAEQRDKQAATGGNRGGRSGGEGRGGRGGGESRGRGGDKRGSDRGGRGGRGRGRRDREEERPEFNETLIDVYRCSATVKGGRRLSFGAMVAVGDGKGRVGIGYGKAKEVPGAIAKARKRGEKDMKRFPLFGEGTIPHQVRGRFGTSCVTLIPARPGTGVIAGDAVKAVLEAGGLSNVLTKTTGSRNTRNLVKATIVALTSLRNKEEIERLRGVTLDA